MDTEDILARLRKEKGILRAEVLPDELLEEIEREESTVTAAMGNMPVINSGLTECISRDVRVCMFEDDYAWHPSATSMRMINGNGETVGHDIPMDKISEWQLRSDVLFLSEDFVIYPEIDMGGTTSMEMLAVEYFGEGGWIPEWQHPVIWYPSSTSSDIIKEFYNSPQDRTAAAILAFDTVRD